MKWLEEDLKANDLPCLIFNHYGIAEDNMEGNYWLSHNKEQSDKYYENLKEIYDKLDLSQNILKQLVALTTNLNNLRPLSLIHGDRHKKNAILKENKQLVFIDWELGGIGDLAYDIHLHQMAYTKEDEKYFLEKLKEEPFK